MDVSDGFLGAVLGNYEVLFMDKHTHIWWYYRHAVGRFALTKGRYGALILNTK